MIGTAAYRIEVHLDADVGVIDRHPAWRPPPLGA